MEAAGSGRGGAGRPMQRKSRYLCREAPCRARLVTCTSKLSPILQMKQRKLVEGHTAGKQGSCDSSPDRDCQTTEPEFDHCLQSRGQVLTWAQSWAVGPGRLSLAMTPSEGRSFCVEQSRRDNMGRRLRGPGGHGQWGRPHRGPWEGPEWTGFQAHVRHPLGTPGLSLEVSEIQPHVAGNWQESCVVANCGLIRTHKQAAPGCLGVLSRAREQCSNCRAGGALGARLGVSTPLCLPRRGPLLPASVSTSVNGDQWHRVLYNIGLSPVFVR